MTKTIIIIVVIIIIITITTIYYEFMVDIIQCSHHFSRYVRANPCFAYYMLLTRRLTHKVRATDSPNQGMEFVFLNFFWGGVVLYIFLKSHFLGESKWHLAMYEFLKMEGEGREKKGGGIG